MQGRQLSSRLVHFDLLRVISIFAVIVLHVAASNWSVAPVRSAQWAWFNIFDSLVRFCVPVLLMISGALLLDSIKEIGFRALLRRYIPHILIALFIWSFLYAAANLASLYFSSRELLLKSFISEFMFGHYHLWYLYMLIGLYLVTPFLRKIVESTALTKYYLLLWLVFSVLLPAIQDIPLVRPAAQLAKQLQLHLVMGYSGYFVLGHYLRSVKLRPRSEVFIYILGILGLIVTIAATQMVSVRLGKADGRFYDNLKPNVVVTAIALFVFFQQRVSHFSFSEKSRSRIASLSDSSFGIYLEHDFLLLLLSKLGITTMLFSPVLSVPLLSLLVFLGSWLVIILMRKNKFLRKYAT